MRNFLPPPMPIMKKVHKTKLFYDEIKIQHCFKYELLQVHDFTLEEPCCELAPLPSPDEALKAQVVAEP